MSTQKTSKAYQPPKIDESFPKDERVLSRKDYLKVQKRGKAFRTRSLVLLVLKNRLERRRIGITVSKKVGKSVKRNRIKRVIREAYRLNKNLFPTSCDVVVVPKRIEEDIGYQTIVDEIRELRWIQGP